jgi:protein SCO1
MKRFILCCILLSSATLHGAAIAPPTLPPDSVYQLSEMLTNQNAKPFTLAAARGHVQLVTMFYSSCQYACPLIIDSALGLEHALSAAESSRLKVLMISLDAARDTPAVLAKIASKRRLDLRRWTLARAEPLAVRKIAAVLGVRYRELANGEFNHSSQLILLDPEGRILARTEKMTTIPDAEFLATLKQALRSPAYRREP